MGRGLVESDQREKTHLLDGTKQREVKRGLSPVNHTVHLRPSPALLVC